MTNDPPKSLEELARFFDDLADECEQAARDKTWISRFRQKCATQSLSFRDAAKITRAVIEQQTSSVVASSSLET